MKKLFWSFWLVDGWKGIYSKYHLFHSDAVTTRRPTTLCGITPSPYNYRKISPVKNVPEDEQCKRCITSRKKLINKKP